tara:strand:- start:17582 stop:17881 length:300 start_codon:yes stop_codon:yes gene_type:complete
MGILDLQAKMRTTTARYNNGTDRRFISLDYENGAVGHNRSCTRDFDADEPNSLRLAGEDEGGFPAKQRWAKKPGDLEANFFSHSPPRQDDLAEMALEEA